jgi:hypothetical protein
VPVPILISPIDGYTTNQATLTFDWYDSTGTASGIASYELQIATDSSFGVVSFSSNPVVSQTFIFQLSSLNYYWHVRAVDRANNYSGWSSTYSIIVDTIPPINVSNYPSNFSGVAASTSSINWTWTDNAVNETGYRLRNSTGGIVTDLTANATSYLETGLSVNTSYYRTIEAYNLSDSSQSAKSVVVYTLASKPINTVLTYYDDTSIEYRWETDWLDYYQNLSVTYYEIEFATNNMFTPAFITTTNLTMITINASVFVPDVVYYFHVRAINGDNIHTEFDNVVISSKTFVTTVIQPSTPKTIIFVSYLGEEFKIDVPADAFTEQVVISVKVQVPFPIPACLLCTHPSCLQPPTPITGLKYTGFGHVYIEIDKPIQPVKEVSITVTYPDSNLTYYDESKFILCYYDTTDLKWITLPSTAYPAQHKVVGRTRHLSEFRVFQTIPELDLNKVIVYPNPYKSEPGGLVFDRLTAKANIKVYTLTGELIVELNETDGDGNYLWDTLTSKNEKTASGVYMYIVTNPDDNNQKPARGKLAIIR